MTAVTSFTVFHKNPEARESLGRGFVIGKTEQRTTFQYQGVLPNNRSEIPAIITEEKIVIKYEVLWENQRHVSPSIHLATDLEWEVLTEEYILALSGNDEEEEDEEEVSLLGTSKEAQTAIAEFESDNDLDMVNSNRTVETLNESVATI